MASLSFLLERAGSWQGTYHLYLYPDQHHTSASRATVIPVLGGRFARVDYDWAYDGAPQEGSLLLGAEEATGAVTAVWIDTWHMGDGIMICPGAANEAGAIVVRGSYAAPPGPDWGWRTELAPDGPDGWRLRMINVTPDGQEMLAVEVDFGRTRSL